MKLEQQLMKLIIYLILMSQMTIQKMERKKMENKKKKKNKRKKMENKKILKKVLNVVETMNYSKY